MIITTEAIILLSRKYGDTSKLVTLFTKDYGRQSVIAKGARNSKNKFGSSLDPLSYCKVSFYKKPNTSLHLLSNSELIKPLRKIHNSYIHLSFGLLILESILQTMEEDNPNEEIFQYLLKSVELLNESECNPVLLFLKFQLILAKDLGFEIDFTENFDNIITNNQFKTARLSIPEGKIVNTQDYIDNNTIIFKNELICLLKQLSETSLENIREYEINKIEFEQIHNFFIKYFSYHLDKKIYYRSQSLINLIN